MTGFFELSGQIWPEAWPKFWLMKQFWIGLSVVSQVMFSARFFVQWLYSEKHGKSLIPRAFWYFSLTGGVLMLIYTLYIREFVLAAGQFAGLFAYSRNLYMVLRDKRRNKAQAETHTTRAEP